jgi:hypothetical protein
MYYSFYFPIGFYSDNDTNSLMDTNSIIPVQQNSTNGHSYSHMNGHSVIDDNDHHDDQHISNGINGDLIHKIKIQNQFYNLDSITPEVISKMNKIEKEIYINKCRQLYTAIYEL